MIATDPLAVAKHPSTITLSRLEVRLGRCPPDPYNDPAPATWYSVARRLLSAIIDTPLAGDRNDPDESTPGRYIALCPAGCADSLEQADGFWVGSLAFEVEGQSSESTAVRVACANGCTPAALAGMIEQLIAEHDAGAPARAEAQRAEARRRARAKFIHYRDKNAAPPAWIVPDILPHGQLTMLLGDPGAGKTNALMHFLICSAMGIPWFGRAVERKRVLAVLVDGAPADYKQTVAVLAEGLGTTYHELMSSDYFFMSFAAVDLSDPASVGELQQAIEDTDAELVGLDALIKLQGNLEENNNSMMRRVMAPLESLRVRGVTVIVPHHANAHGEPRGASAIEAATDHVLHMSRSSKYPDAVITISTFRSRRGVYDSVKYQLVGQREDGIVTPTLIVDTARAPTARKADPDRARMVGLLKKTPMASEELSRAFGGNKSAAITLRNELASEHVRVIEHREDGRWHVVDAGAVAP